MATRKQKILIFESRHLGFLNSTIIYKNTLIEWQTVNGKRWFRQICFSTMIKLEMKSIKISTSDSETKIRLQSTLQKLIKFGFLPKNHPPFDLLCEKADVSLFSSNLVNDAHVLPPWLPPINDMPYALRPRMHDRAFPKSYFYNKMRRNFIPKMITSGTY